MLYDDKLDIQIQKFNEKVKDQESTIIDFHEESNKKHEKEINIDNDVNLDINNFKETIFDYESSIEKVNEDTKIEEETKERIIKKIKFKKNLLFENYIKNEIMSFNDYVVSIEEEEEEEILIQDHEIVNGINILDKDDWINNKKEVITIKKKEVKLSPKRKILKNKSKTILNNFIDFVISFFEIIDKKKKKKITKLIKDNEAKSLRKFRNFEKLLKILNFKKLKHTRNQGSHFNYKHEIFENNFILPYHGKELKSFYWSLFIKFIKNEKRTSQ